MKVDLIGRVRNTRLPLSRPLLPLFEAVINSFQAIEQAKVKPGRIDISVEREPTPEIDGGDGTHAPICGFVVTDNGPGFDEANFSSFETSDSTLKQALGGKGVGRLLWLKAFDGVDVDSVFIEPGGKKSRRTFVFRLDNDGVNDDLVVGVDDSASLQTVVRLRGFKKELHEKCPKGLATIAQKLIEHCLTYFIFGSGVQVRLRDSDGRTLNVNELYKTEFAPHTEKDSFACAGQKFLATHVKLYSAEAGAHRLHFCAHRREVLERRLQPLIPNLTGRVSDVDGRQFYWSTFVSGAALDDHVDCDRTGFTFPLEPSPLVPEELTLQGITDDVLPKVRARLAPYLAPVQQRKMERIRDYIATRAPQYRAVQKYAANELEDVPPDLPEADLDIALHRLSFKMETDVRAANARLASTPPSDDVEGELARLVEKATDIGQSNLAKYVAQRRVILDLLDRSLKARPGGGYALESDIHRIIFPLRRTSDEVVDGQQNLWVIDERLAYHAFLASDKELKTMPIVQVDSGERPDIIIFNNPLAFADGGPSYSSVVVIEFKRPVREQYAEEDNPITQVYGYVAQVRKGEVKDRWGRLLTVKPETPFYCYIICDLTAKVRQFAEEAALTSAPDHLGYFGFNHNRNAYIEVISYDKLVEDAKKRNRAFFDKLGLPLP